VKKVRTAWVLCLLVAIVALGSGCAQYRRKPLAFLMPADMGNAVSIEGAEIGARLLSDRGEAEEAFGFDIISAGVLPVQVVIDNKGSSPVVIDPTQTFLVEGGGTAVRWPVLEQDVAFERISEKTDWGKVAPEAGKGAVIGAVVGAVGGLAVGILTDTGTAEAVGGGAAIGSAAGTVIGGVKGRQEHEDVERSILKDLRTRSLGNKAVEPDAIGHGLIFFGTEAGNPANLLLRVKNTQTGASSTVELAL